MAKPNYKHLKKQREQAQRKKKEAKLQRKLDKKSEPDPVPLAPAIKGSTDKGIVSE